MKIHKFGHITLDNGTVRFIDFHVEGVDSKLSNTDLARYLAMEFHKEIMRHINFGDIHQHIKGNQFAGNSVAIH